MYLVVLLTMCVAYIVALKAMFENFEHLSGYDEALYHLRVRKLNRSTMALNGTVVVKLNAGNEIRMSLDLFHSRLGNQQFNHYPMKLPTRGTCAFLDQLRTDYKRQVNQIENYPALGECPITPRSLIIRDLVFPSEVVPPMLPRGLWKALITGERSGKAIYTYYFLVKVYDEF